MTTSNPSLINEAEPRNSRTPCVVIVGGGFGGLAAAKALRKAPTRNILIDRTNHQIASMCRCITITSS
jgi:NADH dehydrogenase